MKIRLISTVASVAAVVGLLNSPLALSAAHGAKVAEGKKVAFDRKKGNCLSCHAIAGGQVACCLATRNCLSCHAIAGGQAAGNLGPPLVAMKARFPDKQALRAQIWDATNRNPATPMPPFGKHNILTDNEIDLVTEFIHSL